MSAPTASLNADDDGPEEGEIEDDDDDIIFVEGNTKAPVPSHFSHVTSATSTKVHPSRSSTASKDSYERDIRHFERNRATRSRRSSSTKTPHSSRKDDARTKPKYSRTGLTQGKENRHAHRHKSPSYRHRNGSHDRTLADCKDVSPIRKDSSCSSDESVEREIRSPAGRSSSRPHHRLATSARPRSKRKASSSPDSAHSSSKRKSHSSEKCPLMKVLRSVARETRLINNTMETTETTLESSSSLRQRLLNMGAMSVGNEEQSSSSNNATNQSSCISTVIDEKETIIGKEIVSEDPKEPVSSNTVPTIEIFEETNNEIGDKLNSENAITPSKSSNADDVVSPVSSASSVKILECIENDCITESTNITCSPPPICENNCGGDDDDDDDISQLRLLALQSKKHEPPPADDADVLELRLAALKTAFMKKFKIRKRNTVRSIASLSKEDPVSSIDDLPLPLYPGSPEEAMTPVDMELAETDDEATSEHSIDCYSPSDPVHDYFPSDPNPEHLPSLFSLPEPYSPSRPTGSPSREPSLQELLPPPPPPDLDLYLSEPEPNPESCDSRIDNSHEAYFLDYSPTAGTLEPPPLPSYFRDLLSGTPDLPTIPPQDEETSSNLKEENIIAGIEDEITVAHEIISTSESSCHNALAKLPESEDLVKLNHSEATYLGSNAPIINAAESTSKSLPESKENESTEILTNLSSKVETRQATVPLEEEEKMLRQRLLLNMANKKNNALINKDVTKDQSSAVTRNLLERSLKTISSKGRSIVPDVKQKSKTDEVKNNLKAPLQLQPAKSKPVSQVLSVPNSGDENRLIINLEEDSDSCEDYSEAEALGATCAKNREKWLLQMKELEVNPPKILGSAVKTASVVATKVSPRPDLKSRQPLKESSPLKPFAENLADLENSVEQFLKGVRRSHEAVSKTKRGVANVSSATPVAVRHLPPKQQEEYRRLKQQIATLEKQRLMATQKQKKALQSSDEQQKRSESAGEHPKKTMPLVKEQPKKSIPNFNGKLKKNSIPSQEQPKKSIPISNVKLKKKGSLPEVPPSKTLSLSKGTLKTVPNSSVSSRPEKSTLNSSAAAPPKTNSTIAQTSGSQIAGISKIDKGPNQTNLLPVKSVKPNAPLVHKEDLKKKIQGNQNVAGMVNTIGNIPCQKADSMHNVKKTVPLQTKPSETSTSLDDETQTHLSLSNLETTVIKERSNVLNELSALSKLLSQVEKSIVAQSNTATEVSSLLEKLCLAAGRWKAQDKTVTGLVQRVAQRQKELSLRHQSCINASTSCVKLGSASNKGAYRVPVDKADAMRLQLKLVHEKTQDLAKRRTAERARKDVLEKTAEDCLRKLFNDSKRVNTAVVNSPKVSVVGTVIHSKVLTKECKLETAQAPTEVKQPILNPCAESSTELPKHSSLLNPSAASTETQSSSTHIPNISPKVNSAISARAVNNRLALNKVKSAKAVLKLAQTKHRNKKARNGHLKRMHSNSRTEEDSKHDLSDMEISTEDEEADIKGKGVSGNLDVIDMSVSPDTSLSPLDTEREGVNLPNEQDCIIRAISADAGPESSSERWKLPAPLSSSISPMEDPIASNGEQRQFSKPAGKGILKDYVSPLGGLSVFSNDVEGIAKQGDLYAILCPYELNGKCEDTECAFKHQNNSVTN